MCLSIRLYVICSDREVVCARDSFRLGVRLRRTLGHVKLILLDCWCLKIILLACLFPVSYVDVSRCYVYDSCRENVNLWNGLCKLQHAMILNVSFNISFWQLCRLGYIWTQFRNLAFSFLILGSMCTRF